MNIQALWPHRTISMKKATITERQDEKWCHLPNNSRWHTNSLPSLRFLFHVRKQWTQTHCILQYTVHTKTNRNIHQKLFQTQHNTTQHNNKYLPQSSGLTIWKHGTERKRHYFAAAMLALSWTISFVQHLYRWLLAYIYVQTMSLSPKPWHVKVTPN
jgi:hypothetical protein